MKPVLLLLASAGLSLANTAPTVVIQSAAMRPGTTLMDVVYRVNDPDDAVVKTRALAFVDGVRSFAKVIKPVTFAEGTAAKLGDAIATNTDHTVTWNVGADWNIDLGQIKFEVLALDSRGLLPLDWITIPAVADKPAVTVSKNSPTDEQLLDSLFWQYASGDTGLSLLNGMLTGTANSGVFNKVSLANGTSIHGYAGAYVLKKMNLDPATAEELAHVADATRMTLDPKSWYAANRPYTGVSIVVVWGKQMERVPAGLNGAAAVVANNEEFYALKNDRKTIVRWGGYFSAEPLLPLDHEISAIAVSNNILLALRTDKKVVYGGGDEFPGGWNNVTAICVNDSFRLGVKTDGTVVRSGEFGHISEFVLHPMPSVLTGIANIKSINTSNVLALKTDGTIQQWGDLTSPALSQVVAIAQGNGHGLALQSNGSVKAWGQTWSGISTVPAGLSGVTAIAAGMDHSLALKSDGTVVAWGNNASGQCSVPVGLNGVIAIAAGEYCSIAIKAKAP